MFNFDRIKQLSKEKGLSITFLCTKLGMAKTFFHDLIKTGRNIPEDKLIVLADLLNTTPAYLLGESDQKEKSPSGIPDRLLKELSENPAKLELALLICDWDDDKLDRALKLLDASLLLPKEDQPS